MNWMRSSKCEQPIMVLNRRLRKNSSHSVWSDHKASCQDAVLQLIAKGTGRLRLSPVRWIPRPALSDCPVTKMR